MSSSAPDAHVTARKICVVTGTRAEYGCLRWVMEGIRATPGLELQLIATGTHLSPEFGLTYREIEKDGFRIDRKVEMLLSSDTPDGVTKSMGLGLIGFGSALAELRPHMLFVLGDRFEILAAAAAGMIARLPIAHAHGGELTEGAFDDAIRHAITKMAQLHFVAADDYRRRVIQLGEDPARVHLVGGLGIDNIKRLKLLDRAALEQSLGMQLRAKSLLVTFHPVTLEDGTSGKQMSELLSALGTLGDTSIIFTLPNADTGGRVLIDLIGDFVSRHPNTKAFPSLGQLRYLSCISQVDGVVGNSSSGLSEVPSFGKGTINIGDRQRGRLKARSVIDCEPTAASIVEALDKLYSQEFRATLKDVRNPYGEGGASEAIVEVLRTYPYGAGLKKSFHDLRNLAGSPTLPE